MAVVPRVRTPLSRTELHDAIAAGYRAHFGVEPTREQVGVAWSQLCLEHANGSALYCNNFGNVDAVKPYDGDTFELTANEVLHGHTVQCTKSLCAFATPVDGAQYYWHLLDTRYASVLPSFAAGNPTAAAIALRNAHYYTASAIMSAKAMASLYADYVRLYPNNDN